MKAISILACGADPTAQRLSTSAIQQAINSAQENDVIVIPQGRFLTGALFLKKRCFASPGCWRTAAGSRSG